MQYEKPMSDFLYAYMKKNYPWLNTSKQYVGKNRYNIFATDGYPTKLLVVNHIDTVPPNNGWDDDPCTAIQKDQKIYGLGASDTKANIASFLSALDAFSQTRGLSILWYVDEEYNFEGMKTFIGSDIAESINPAYILSIDGNNMDLGIACRGLLEYRLILKGTSEHSANKQKPQVIDVFMTLQSTMTQWLKSFATDLLGEPSVNIARITAGARSDQDNTFLNSANMTADYIEALVEIRTTPVITYPLIRNYIQTSLSPYKDISIELEFAHDESGFETMKKNISDIENILQNIDNTSQILDASTFGYLDVAMLGSIYPDATIFSCGIGTPGQAHRPNEYIDIKNIKQGEKLYRMILDRYVQAQEI